MKKILLLAAVLVLAGRPARALEKGALEFGGQFGIGFPVGNLADLSSAGPILGAHARYGLDRRVSLIGELQYALFGTKDLTASIESEAKSLGVNVLGRIDLTPTRGVTPYLLGGLGLSSVKTEITGVPIFGTFSTSETELGLHLGAGVEKKLPSMDIGGDLRFSRLGDNATMISIIGRISFGT